MITKKSRIKLANIVEDKMKRMCGCENCVKTIKSIILNDNMPVSFQCDKCWNKECALQYGIKKLEIKDGNKIND